MDLIQKGHYGESLALQFYLSRNYQLLAKNFRTKLGEIDLIVKNRSRLIFAEVKFRSREDFLNWDSSYWPRKIARMRILSREFEYRYNQNFSYEKKLEILEIIGRRVRVVQEIDLEEAWFT